MNTELRLERLNKVAKEWQELGLVSKGELNITVVKAEEMSGALGFCRYQISKNMFTVNSLKFVDILISEKAFNGYEDMELYILAHELGHREQTINFSKHLINLADNFSLNRDSDLVRSEFEADATAVTILEGAGLMKGKFKTLTLGRIIECVLLHNCNCRGLTGRLFDNATLQKLMDSTLTYVNVMPVKAFVNMGVPFLSALSFKAAAFIRKSKAFDLEEAFELARETLLA